VVERFVIGKGAAQAQKGFQASHAQGLSFYDYFDSIAFP